MKPREATCPICFASVLVRDGVLRGHLRRRGNCRHHEKCPGSGKKVKPNAANIQAVLDWICRHQPDDRAMFEVLLNDVSEKAAGLVRAILIGFEAGRVFGLEEAKARTGDERVATLEPR